MPPGAAVQATLSRSVLEDDVEVHIMDLVEALGMRYINIPMIDKGYPESAQIEQFLKIANDPATGKFFVHCAGGRHRTGVMGAVYRFNNYHWNFDQVYAEMENFDFYTSNGHSGQKRFVEGYAQRMQSEIATQSAAQGSK